MSDEYNLIWSEPEWKRDAESWIEARLRDAGIEIRGPSDQFHVRPWSTVFKVPTGRGSFFFKALPGPLRHEVAVVEYLSARFPGRIPRVLAVDRERGWMLLYKGGELLRDRLRRRASAQEWQQLLNSYAKMQSELAPDSTTLLTLGVPDRRPGVLPVRLTELLSSPDVLHLDKPDGLSKATLGELTAEGPKVQFLCEQLAAGPVPITVDHGDLHDANVFWNQGGPVIFDWADCSLTHPFFSLRTVFVSLENTLGWEPDDPRVRGIGDRYLEGWKKWAPLPALRRVFHAAVTVAPLISALRWKRALETLPAAQTTYIEPIPRLLEELLANIRNDSRLG